MNMLNYNKVYCLIVKTECDIKTFFFYKDMQKRTQMEFIALSSPPEAVNKYGLDF